MSSRIAVCGSSRCAPRGSVVGQHGVAAQELRVPSYRCRWSPPPRTARRAAARTAPRPGRLPAADRAADAIRYPRAGGGSARGRASRWSRCKESHLRGVCSSARISGNGVASAAAGPVFGGHRELGGRRGRRNTRSATGQASLRAATRSGSSPSSRTAADAAPQPAGARQRGGLPGVAPAAADAAPNTRGWCGRPSSATRAGASVRPGQQGSAATPPPAPGRLAQRRPPASAPPRRVPSAPAPDGKWSHRTTYHSRGTSDGSGSDGMAAA